MPYVFKLARRLAQAHVAILGIVLLACNDAAAPSVESSQTALVSPAAPSATTGARGSTGFLTTGNTAHPNEPAGFLMLSDRPFNSKVENGWRDRGDPRFSISQDRYAPQSPSNVGTARFPAGWKGGSGPINTWYMLKGAKRSRIYVSFWLKLSAGWQGHKSGVNKVLFFQVNQKNMVNLDAHGIGPGALHPQISAQGINETPTTHVFSANLNSALVLGRGQWQHWEVILTANTNGLSNGSAEWWLNGTRAGYHSNISFLPASASNNWEAVIWNPTWGGVGDVVQKSQDMYIDDIYVSGA